VIEHDSERQSSDTGVPSTLPYLSPWKPLRRLSLEGVAVVACRVLALWAGIQVLQYLTYSLFLSIVSVATSPWSSFRWSVFAPQFVLLPQLLVFAAAAAVLWFKAGWLSERITRLLPPDASPAGSGVAHEQSKPPVRSPAEDAAPLLAILLTVTGIFVLAEAVPELARAISAPLYLRGRDASQEWMGAVLGSQFFWPAIVKLAIGAWLLLGPGAIARLVLKLRKGDPHTRTPAVEPVEDADGPL